MYYLKHNTEKLFAKFLIGLGIVLLALWLDLNTIYIIFFVLLIATTIYCFESENIIIKSVGFILLIYILSFFFLGSLGLTSFFLAMDLVTVIDELKAVIGNLPKDFLLYCGLGCLGIGLFDFKSNIRYKIRQPIMFIALIIMGTFLYFSFFSEEKLSFFDISIGSENYCELIVPDYINVTEKMENNGFFDTDYNSWKNGFTFDASHFGVYSYSGLGMCHWGSKVGENVNHLYCEDLNAVRHIKTIDENGNIIEDKWIWFKVNLELADTGKIITVRTGSSHPLFGFTKRLKVFKVVDAECIRKA